MWFKNLQIYTLPADWRMTAGRLEEVLARHPLIPCGATSLQSQGWISPAPAPELVYGHAQHLLLALGSENKLLPGAVVTQATRERAAALEKQQGFPPGRKQLRDLKDQITLELLPRAFVRRRNTRAWVDMAGSRMVVEAGSANGAENLLKVLRDDLSELPVTPLEVSDSPAGAMTRWLVDGVAPAPFALEQDCELVGAEKSAVRFVRHDLQVNEIRTLIADGMTASRVGLLWRDRISFVLTDKLAIKRVRYQTMDEDDSEARPLAEEDRFNADFTLMTAELGALIEDLAKVLGARGAG